VIRQPRCGSRDRHQARRPNFRATGIAAHLKNGGTCKEAAANANHASTLAEEGAGTKEAQNIMLTRYTLTQVLEIVLIGAFCAVAGPDATAQAQTPPPGPAPVQPWGLPPLPPGVGPVEKFADVSGTPQGKFLEGGSFDTKEICGT
jgi:hypothetical protein